MLNGANLLMEISKAAWNPQNAGGILMWLQRFVELTGASKELRASCELPGDPKEAQYLTELTNTLAATVAKHWFLPGCVRNSCTRETCKALHRVPTDAVKHLVKNLLIFEVHWKIHTQSWCWDAFNQESLFTFGFSSCQSISCHFYLRVSENFLAEFED